MAATSELGTRVPRKAKSVLDRLVGSRAMTQEGMEWLICATDPFHDDRVRCPGYPDMSTVNSVVQTYTTTTSVQPTNQTTPWDLHIPFVPISYATGLYATGNGGLRGNSYNANGKFTGAGNSNLVRLYPGYNLITCTTPGADWGTDITGVCLNSSVVEIPTKYCSGHFSLIAAGVEVVNTTAELYRGGSLTAYRAPSCIDNGFIYYPTNMTALTTTTETCGTSPERKLVRKSSHDDLAGIYPIPLPHRFVSLPPTTQAEAASYTDSRTWSAVDGAYSIATQSNMDNPFQSLIPRDVCVKKTLDSATVGGIPTQNMWVSESVTSITGNTDALGSNTTVFPFDCSGVILAGLDQHSTIQVTVRYYFERIPATTEPDLLAMAQVPPAFDGVAMEIYSRCLGMMPVGVPQNENPLGEWFSSILDSIKMVAPKLGGIVTGVGKAISEIGGAPPVQSNATPQAKQNKKQKKAVKNAAKKKDFEGPPISKAMRKRKKKAALKRRNGKA